MNSKAPGLIEFALPLFGRMQRHRENPIPRLLAQGRQRLANQQISEKGFEPEGTLVFVAMNDFQNHTAGADGRTRERKVKFQLTAIAAFKRFRNLTLKWQAATPAERRPDESDLLPAA